jgi:(p)ppGpp synthase/HD superfamily hydrolase
MMAGYLHDVLEDTTWTAADLERLGLPPRVLETVQAVTNMPGEAYQDKIMKVALSGRDATLVKISDNAHNSRPDRLAHLDAKTRQRLEKKYAKAREVLWAVVPAVDVGRIVGIVNPALLGE